MAQGGRSLYLIKWESSNYAQCFYNCGIVFVYNTNNIDQYLLFGYTRGQYAGYKDHAAFQLASGGGLSLGAKNNQGTQVIGDGTKYYTIYHLHFH